MYFYYAPLLSTKKFKHKLLLYFHLLRFRYDPKSRNCHYGFVGSMVINLLNQWPVAHKIFCIQSVFVEQTFISKYLAESCTSLKTLKHVQCWCDSFGIIEVLLWTSYLLKLFDSEPGWPNRRCRRELYRRCTTTNADC